MALNPKKGDTDPEISEAKALDRFTSMLGQYNPFHRPVAPSTTLIWLFDNTANRTVTVSGQNTHSWEAEFVAAYFVRRSGRSESNLLAEITTKLGLAKNQETENEIRKRLIPLLNDILPARTVEIQIGGKVNSAKSDVTVVANSSNSTRIASDESPSIVETLGPSDSNGISRNIITFRGTRYKDGEIINSTTLGDTPCITAHTTFADETGWAIISDIDDTIKHTLTSSVTGILKTTFIDTPEPIEGMPEFYRHMNRVLSDPPFWYLSASPYNLYPFLHEFRDKWYPAGTMLLRDASWQNVTGFLASLTVNTKDYKEANVTAIHSVFPKRKFICLGDSTQSDPEVYGDMYRKYPGWIKAIFIRKVTHISEVTDIIPGKSDEERNRDERFEKAFENVPIEIWEVFKDPSELYEKLQGAINREGEVP